MASDRNWLFLKAVFCPAFDSMLSFADYCCTEYSAWHHHLVAVFSWIDVSTGSPSSAFFSEMFQGSSFPLLNHLKLSGNYKQDRLLYKTICTNRRTNYFPMQY